MLIADVLSTDTTLNSFDVIGSLQFIPGEETTLFIRLKQPMRKDLLRYVAPDTATLTISLPKKDGTMLEIEAEGLEGDLSIWSSVLEETDTEELIGGNFNFVIDLLGDGTKIIKGWVQNGLNLVTTGDC